MASDTDISRVAIQLSRGIVIASIQIELDDAVLEQFRKDLLGRVHQSGARGVILDVSGLDILDAHEFEALRGIITMTGLLGAETVLVGMQPGIVSALVTLGVELDGVASAVDLDAAFALLEDENDSDLAPELDVSDTFEESQDPFETAILASLSGREFVEHEE